MLLRSLLFVPGNQPRMLEKALGLAPDAFVPDLEDSVPDGEKANARETVAMWLSRLGQVGPPVIPRVNSLPSGLIDNDLGAVIGPDTFGVSVGKVGSPEEVGHIDTLLLAAEDRAAIKLGQTKLVLWLETALAIVNAYEICSASPRIIGVAFGAEDFTNDMAIERTDDDSEIGYARNVVTVAARAANVVALDTPYFSFRNTVGLEDDARRARKLGFRGKFAIHPTQIEAINRVFSPADSEIDTAKRVVAAFEEAEREGRGSTSLDGMVIDVPVVKRARQLIEQAHTSVRVGEE